MTPRKGNLMGVRTDIKVLDATIRDGVTVYFCKEYSDVWDAVMGRPNLTLPIDKPKRKRRAPSTVVVKQHD